MSTWQQEADHSAAAKSESAGANHKCLTCRRREEKKKHRGNADKGP